MLETRLTIKHLKMIHAIESAETLTRAADMLNISQPALSSRLSDAEELLGTRLFIRRGRRLSLSTSGQLLLRAARAILQELSQVEHELLNLPDQVGQVLRIAVPQHASFSWLPAAIQAFEAEFPTVELEIVSKAAQDARQALFRNEVDVALVSSPNKTVQVDKTRFRCRRLFRDEFIALLPTDHENAGRPFLVAEDFIEETYITNSAVPERNREYELFFQPLAVYPERVMQVGFTKAILDLVAAGIGTTIVTKWIMDSDVLKGVTALPLNKNGLHVYWFAIFPRKTEVENPALLLADVVSNQGAGGGR